MPPKVKVTKEEIINAALALVRENGTDAINARSIAASLACSTQPIFSNFATMEELQKDVILAAYNLYLAFIEREVKSGSYPPYKAFGMAYIRFAKEEKELFKLLFMRDRTNEDIATSPDFEESVQMIMQANKVSQETACLIHLEMWTCVHGIGTILATSFMPLDWELISNMLTDVYQGIRARHVAKENENGCH